MSDEHVEALLCGAVKQLRSQKSKDSALFLTLIYLAKTRPLLFCTEIVVEAFASLLKSEKIIDKSLTVKAAKPVNVTAVLAANVLLAAYHEETSWPEAFLKSYVEDSLAERSWVDHEDCKGFVDNIITAFNTKLPPKSMLVQEMHFVPAKNETASSSPSHPSMPTVASLPVPEEHMDESSSHSVMAMSAELKEHLDNISVVPRFVHNQDSIIQYVTDLINEQLNKRQVPSDINRNMIKFLVATAGIPNVRLIVAQKLEMWIQNPKVLMLN